MVPRIFFVLLGVGILSTIYGCVADPYLYDMAPAKVYIPPEIYPRYQYREEKDESDDGRKSKVYIPQEAYERHQYREERKERDYERQMDEEEQQYRKKRSEQEQQQERSYQQWQQERARERDPGWER